MNTQGKQTDVCPKCHADLTGDPIPQASIDAGYYGDATHFSRRIGRSSRELDRVTHWLCPDCGHEWERKRGDF